MSASLYEVPAADRTPEPEPWGNRPSSVRVEGLANEYRVLVVSKDRELTVLVRAIFHLFDVDVQEAVSERSALEEVRRSPVDIVVLDDELPGASGLDLCQRLRQEQGDHSMSIVVVAGNEDRTESIALELAAEASVAKPIDPLLFLQALDKVSGGSIYEEPARETVELPVEEQLMLCAHDFRRLLDLIRSQRALLLRAAGEETAASLARAVASKDGEAGLHMQRVQRYALELTTTVDPRLLEDPSLTFGYLLHDIGKIGIPDRILKKTSALMPAERRCLETHPILGEQMLAAFSSLRGQGLRVVRNHHERWDGSGYPDGLSAEQIPPGARIFAVADTLEAITCGRPYQAARSWKEAVEIISMEAGHQLDPAVVEAAIDQQLALRRIWYEYA